ncbi:glutathione S-transferase-like [Homalodisca vitripennis]|uniref:glutathione S-transferase-like n=1 Tax=Homalodisca vitripennis TaxID=197043 RepID=UPI001EEA4BFE|nr:glutathione S-transferase-like [Homalodisca vitripennis]
MASQWKMTYFPVKGLGESIRFLLAYLDKEYEDHRFNVEDWPSIKPTTPWGQTPVLEANGQTVTQSIAITRYLGRQAGLCGADAWEDMRIDEIVYVINDLRAELAKYHYEKDEKRKEEVKGTVLSTTAPFYLSRLDAHVKANNGYLANGKLSWADLYFAAISDYLSFMYGSDITAGYPNLTELREKVLALPKIKEWVSKRPVTNV